MNKELLTKKITQLADSSGIDVLGFADASDFPDYALSHSRRRDPKISLQNARTIIVAGIYIGALTLPSWTNPLHGRTSRLYLSGFFLDVVKPLEPISNFLTDEGYKTVICDSSTEEGSILPLKLAAVRAGLGWQGKHSLLISKKFGTFLALGGIITNAVLEHNTMVEADLCRKCEKCQKACPLGALNKPYVLNRSKCLSNLLQSEDLPEEAKDAMENRISDCEICQNACPWNRKHLTHALETGMTKLFKERIEDWKPFFYLPDLVNITEKKYIEKLGHLKTEIPYNLFRRNVLIAMENAKKSDRGC